MVDIYKCDDLHCGECQCDMPESIESEDPRLLLENIERTPQQAFDIRAALEFWESCSIPRPSKFNGKDSFWISDLLGCHLPFASDVNDKKMMESGIAFWQAIRRHADLFDKMEQCDAFEIRNHYLEQLLLWHYSKTDLSSADSRHAEIAQAIYEATLAHVRGTVVRGLWIYLLIADKITRKSEAVHPLILACISTFTRIKHTDPADFADADLDHPYGFHGFAFSRAVSSWAESMRAGGAVRNYDKQQVPANLDSCFDGVEISVDSLIQDEDAKHYVMKTAFPSWQDLHLIPTPNENLRKLQSKARGPSDGDLWKYRSFIVLPSDRFSSEAEEARIVSLPPPDREAEKQRFLARVWAKAKTPPITKEPRFNAPLLPPLAPRTKRNTLREYATKQAAMYSGASEAMASAHRLYGTDYAVVKLQDGSADVYLINGPYATMLCAPHWPPVLDKHLPNKYRDEIKTLRRTTTP